MILHSPPSESLLPLKVSKKEKWINYTVRNVQAIRRIASSTSSVCPSFGRTQTGAWNAILDARRYADRFYSKRSRMNGESRRKERENEVARRKRVGKRGKQEEGGLWVEWTHTRVVCMGEGRGRATYTCVNTCEQGRISRELWNYVYSKRRLLSPNLLLLLPLLFFLFFSLFLLLAFASFFFFSEASLEQRNSSKREEKLFHPCVLIICG